MPQSPTVRTQLLAYYLCSVTCDYYLIQTIIGLGLLKSAKQQQVYWMSAGLIPHDPEHVQALQDIQEVKFVTVI